MSCSSVCLAFLRISSRFSVRSVLNFLRVALFTVDLDSRRIPDPTASAARPARARHVKHTVRRPVNGWQTRRLGYGPKRPFFGASPGALRARPIRVHPARRWQRTQSASASTRTGSVHGSGRSSSRRCARRRRQPTARTEPRCGMATSWPSRGPAGPLRRAWGTRSASFLSATPPSARRGRGP